MELPLPSLRVNIQTLKWGMEDPLALAAMVVEPSRPQMLNGVLQQLKTLEMVSAATKDNETSRVGAFFSCKLLFRICGYVENTGYQFWAMISYFCIAFSHALLRLGRLVQRSLLHMVSPFKILLWFKGFCVL